MLDFPKELIEKMNFLWPYMNLQGGIRDDAPEDIKKMFKSVYEEANKLMGDLM